MLKFVKFGLNIIVSYGFSYNLRFIAYIAYYSTLTTQ